MSSLICCNLICIEIQTYDSAVMRKVNRQRQPNIAQSHYRKICLSLLQSFYKIHFPSSSLYCICICIFNPARHGVSLHSS